jgi:hypothetical protein
LFEVKVLGVQKELKLTEGLLQGFFEFAPLPEPVFGLWTYQDDPEESRLDLKLAL